MSDFSSSKKVKIRKERKCVSCERHFPIGTKMIYNSGNFQGNMYSVYNCITCEVIILTIQKQDLDIFYDGIPESFVKECIASGENPNQTPEEYLQLLLKNNNGKY